MLQRAASNAYSWWWASHVRTKQSKWLEQSLLDMEEKVQVVLKLISEDGDSFAKRAEMYYKKRPELIEFVEESYRAYRALAERYDKISTELQNANNTIASVFPEQVQFSMDDDDDDDGPPKMAKNLPDASSKMNIPEVPKGPMKDFKSIIATTKAAKKLLPNKKGTAAKKIAYKKTTKTAPTSGISKPEALEKIDKFQKHILSLQTEKEFVKSSYENGLAKYWEIEEKIKETQAKVSSLQDEVGDGMVIDDGEARTLMALSALKSCQDKLSQLQEQQEKSTEEARKESQRIKEARERLAVLKDEFNCNQINEESSPRKQESVESSKVGNDLKSLEEDVASTTKDTQELEVLREKIKEQFDDGPDTSLTVIDMVEKIDGLVNKVINLENAVSSQNALVRTLRNETNELQSQIQTMENYKASLIDDKNALSNKLKEMEEKLNKIQDLNENFKDKNHNLETHFTEVHCNLDHLSEKLQIVKPDEEIEGTASTGTENQMNVKRSQFSNPLKREEASHNEVRQEPKKQEERSDIGDGSAKVTDAHGTSSCERHEDVSRSVANKEQMEKDGELKERIQGEDDEPDRQKLFLSGMEDRDKNLLGEYNATLRNYNDVKKKLSELEKENQDSRFETSVLIKELENSNAKKDEEIKSLRLKLDLLTSALESKDAQALDSEKTLESLGSAIKNKHTTQDEKREDIIAGLTEQTCIMTAVEEKFRMDIDELLEENLDFWMKFSSSFHQIQKFETEIQDLQKEISKVNKKKEKEGSNTLKQLFKSDVRPLYQHLREIQTELTVWLEKSVTLKEELQRRFTSLCNIQEEITKALKTSTEDDDFKFTTYQAAKFQGEVLNMKQENNKVADELQAGLDHVTTLQISVEKTLNNLKEEYEITGSKKNNDTQLTRSNSAGRNQVPLRSFIFGVKQKKQKSIFSCMTPGMHKKYLGKSGPL